VNAISDGITALRWQPSCIQGGSPGQPLGRKDQRITVPVPGRDRDVQRPAFTHEERGLRDDQRRAVDVVDDDVEGIRPAAMAVAHLPSWTAAWRETGDWDLESTPAQPARARPLGKTATDEL
jgi:hypothetical protein